MMDIPPLVLCEPWRKLTIGIVSVGLCCFVIATFLGTRKSGVQDQDFGAYYRAGQAAIAGDSPYVIDAHGPLGAYMYAPVFAQTIFRLLAHLRYLWAVRVFMAINWGATLLCIVMTLRLFRTPGRDLVLVGTIALVPTFDYFKANVHNGQVGTLLLLACLGWLVLMIGGRNFIGGLVLAIAVTLKLYPGVLVIYLLLRKDWRGLAGVAAGLLILFGVPALAVGWKGLIPLHVQWLRFCFSTQIADQTVRTGNQSLLGVLARLPWICRGNQAIVSMDNLHRLLNIYPEIVAALTAVIFTCLFFIKLNPLRDTAVLLVWMTLAAPRAWTFNFCVELLPAVYLATVIADRRQQSWLAIAALVCIPIAIVFPTNSLSFGDRWALWSYLLQNKHFIAAAIVALAVVKIPGKTVIPPRCPVELPARVPLENIG